MSSSNLSSLTSSSLGHAAPSPYQSQSPNNVATNTVTLTDGTTVRVRIEATLAVEDVVRQLCASVKIQDPSYMYALRDKNDEPVTDENLKEKIMAKKDLKLANCPAKD